VFHKHAISGKTLGKKSYVCEWNNEHEWFFNMCAILDQAPFEKGAWRKVSG
jgi:hypothetical protein